MVYMACKNDELRHTGYGILDGMVDTLLPASAVQQKADLHTENPEMKVEKMRFWMAWFTLFSIHQPCNKKRTCARKILKWRWRRCKNS